MCLTTCLHDLLWTDIPCAPVSRFMPRPSTLRFFSFAQLDGSDPAQQMHRLSLYLCRAIHFRDRPGELISEGSGKQFPLRSMQLTFQSVVRKAELPQCFHACPLSRQTSCARPGSEHRFYILGFVLSCTAAVGLMPQEVCPSPLKAFFWMASTARCVRLPHSGGSVPAY